MTPSARPLRQAPAWIFLAVCAGSSLVLAALAVSVGPAASTPAAVRPAPAKFSLASVPAAPQSAPEPEHKAAQKPALAGAAPIAAPPAAATPVAAMREKIAAPAKPAAAQSPPAMLDTAPSAQAPIRIVPPNTALPQSTVERGESQYGAKLHDAVVVKNFRFPLPPGEWRVAADVPTATGQEVALVREEGKLIAAVVIVSHYTAGGLGFPAHRACSRRMLRGAVEKNEDFGDQACWSAALIDTKSTRAQIEKTALGRALSGDLEAKGMSYQSELALDTWIVVSATSRRVVLLTLHNPEAEGFEPVKLAGIENSPWHPNNLAQHPDRAKYIRDRLLWASDAFQQMKRTFSEGN